MANLLQNFTSAVSSIFARKADNTVTSVNAGAIGVSGMFPVPAAGYYVGGLALAASTVQLITCATCRRLYVVPLPGKSKCQNCVVRSIERSLALITVDDDLLSGLKALKSLYQTP